MKIIPTQYRAKILSEISPSMLMNKATYRDFTAISKCFSKFNEGIVRSPHPVLGVTLIPYEGISK